MMVSTQETAGGRYGAMTDQVRAFLMQLRRTPLDVWRRVGATDPGTPEARARLRAAMNAQPAVARRIRAEIDRDLAVLEGMASAGDMARMRRAARLGACALAAQPLLAPDDFVQLYAPFRAVLDPSVM